MKNIKSHYHPGLHDGFYSGWLPANHNPIPSQPATALTDGLGETCSMSHPLNESSPFHRR